jgi:hypothetical protein
MAKRSLLSRCPLYLPEDDIVEVEKFRRHINNKWLLITYCETCGIKYCIMNLVLGIWITYKYVIFFHCPIYLIVVNKIVFL